MKKELRKYKNRKLYDMQAKRYTTLEAISQMILQGHEVEVRQEGTGVDVTNEVLGQVVALKSKGLSRSKLMGVLRLDLASLL
jgi:polyhydroxyalkanoate synthesis regulator protein